MRARACARVRACVSSLFERTTTLVFIKRQTKEKSNIFSRNEKATVLPFFSFLSFSFFFTTSMREDIFFSFKP